jgi:hypothetical protein
MPDTRARTQDRVSVLREQALQLLQECYDHTAGANGTSPDAVVALQAAANKLGVAQAELGRPAATDLEPAAFGGEPPRPDDREARMTAEAAALLALAETTIDSAVSRPDEAERWLRLLRHHGRVGAALKALSVRKGQLVTRAEPRASRARARRVSAVAPVADNAVDFARQRGAAAMTTVDVLFAVIACYGQLFDRALYGANTSREALIAELRGERAPQAATAESLIAR